MEELIASTAETLCSDNLPVYYKYRYTFPKDSTLEDQIQLLNLIVKYIRSHYMLGEKITSGIEYYTKGMQTTRPHCHIHFVSKIKSDTIRKGIAREFDFVGRVQCCKAEVLVDEEKFWRYPLKQQKNDTYKWLTVYGFTKEETITMRDIAYACWKQSAQITVGKMEKKLERSSYDRLVLHLDHYLPIEDFDYVRDIRGMRISAYQYYVKNEDSFNTQTINGYVDKYILLKGYITMQQYYDIINK